MADKVLNIIKSDDYNSLLSDKINYNFNTLADCINSIIPERGDIGIPGAKGADGLKGVAGDPAPKIYIYDKSYNTSDSSSVSIFKSWCSDKGVTDGSVVIFAKDGIITSVDWDYSINETYVNIPEDTLDTVLSSEYDTKFIFSFGLDNSVYLRKYMCIPDYVKGIILAKSVSKETWNAHNEVFPGFISLFADNSKNTDKDWYISNNNTLNGIQLGINNAGRLVENDSAYFKYTTIPDAITDENQYINVSDFIVYIDRGSSSDSSNEFGARIVNSLKGNNNNVFFSFGSGKGYYEKSSGIDVANDMSFLLSDPDLNYISVSADKISTSSQSFIFQVGGRIYNIKNSTYNGVNIRVGSYKCNDNFFNLYDIYSGLALTYTTSDKTSEPENQDKVYGGEIFNIETEDSDNFTQMVVSGGSFSTEKDNIFTGSVVISGGDSYFLESKMASTYSGWSTLDKNTYVGYKNIGGSVFIEGGELTTLDKDNSDGYTPILINSCNNDENDENIGYDRTSLDIDTVSINSSKLIYMYGYGNIFFNKLNNETNIKINSDGYTSIEFNVPVNLFINYNKDGDKPISNPTGSVSFSAKNIYFNIEDKMESLYSYSKNIDITSGFHFVKKKSYYIFESDDHKFSFRDKIRYTCGQGTIQGVQVSYAKLSLTFNDSSFVCKSYEFINSRKIKSIDMKNVTFRINNYKRRNGTKIIPLNQGAFHVEVNGKVYYICEYSGTIRGSIQNALKGCLCLREVTGPRTTRTSNN